MNKKIQILKDTLINKIAAGEVVERPSCVVKELVENSIDAGATKIIIEVEDGGKKLIKVIDNGCGMCREDAILSIKRYATSKIKEEGDLERIETLGFRGEALPSIASVCRLEIITREKDEGFGTKVVVEGGGEEKVMDIGASLGTIVSVKDLFFNIPARKKFLRSSQSEFARIVDSVIRFSLYHIGINFKLIHNGRIILDYPPQNSLIERAFMVFGREVKGRLFFIQGQRNKIEINGLISDPQLVRNDTHRLFYYINGRFIMDPILRSATLGGYENLIPKGRYPFSIISIKIPADMVDVNVHPQKSEVRFSNGKEVFEGVLYAIKNVILKSPWTSVSISFKEKPKILPVYSEIKEREKKEEFLKFSETGYKYFSEYKPCGFNVIGQFENTFILCEKDGQLWIIDQHGAHERVLFEKIKNLMREKKLESQRLLFPLNIEFSPAEVENLEKGSEILKDYGFDIEPFSGNSLIVHCVPKISSNRNPENTIRELISIIGEYENFKVFENLTQRIISTIACHSAVRKGDSLSIEEIKELLKEMEKTDLAIHCPHGRRVMVNFSFDEVSSWFGRK